MLLRKFAPLLFLFVLAAPNVARAGDNAAAAEALIRLIHEELRRMADELQAARERAECFGAGACGSVDRNALRRGWFARWLRYPFT